MRDAAAKKLRVTVVLALVVGITSAWADEEWDRRDLMTSSTCTIYEIKPDSDAAKSEGNTQLGQYRQGLENWYAKDKYLRPEHVAAIGGRERIAAVVQPAEIREVADLLYVQVTGTATRAG